MLYPFFQHARVRGPFVQVGSAAAVVVVDVARLTISAETTAAEQVETNATRHAAMAQNFIVNEVQRIKLGGL